MNEKFPEASVVVESDWEGDSTETVAPAMPALVVESTTLP